MKKSRNKNSFKAYIKKLNEIDINDLIASLQQINFDDLKNVDLKKLFAKTRKSPIIKPAIGILGASLLFTFLLLPRIELMISSFKKARQYETEANTLQSKKDELRKNQEKIKKGSQLMSEVDDSIISDDKLIFITKLINQTAIKTNVQIISFLPIDVARSAKLCKQSNQKGNRRKGKIKRKANFAKKGSIQSNFYEINLRSDYLNIIEFLNVIQYYDVTIIPHCLQVSSSKKARNSGSTNDSVIDGDPTIITPLSQSGLPLNKSRQKSQTIGGTSYGRVESRLVLKIPSHSR